MPLYLSGARPSALPETGRKSARPPRWWQTPYGRARLEAELAAMQRFPRFRLSRSSGQLRWSGRLESGLGSGERYLVHILYPDEFPDTAPVAVIGEPTLPPGTPHLLWGNQPCLYRPSHGARDGYDAARTTAATLVAWTALWIHAFETWRATGTWPGRAE